MNVFVLTKDTYNVFEAACVCLRHVTVHSCSKRFLVNGLVSGTFTIYGCRFKSPNLIAVRVSSVTRAAPGDICSHISANTLISADHCCVELLKVGSSSEI